MIKMRNLFHRLDIQLSAIVGGIVVLWLISFLISAYFMNKERLEKNTYLERERIQLRIKSLNSQILNDILLDHKRSLELTAQNLYHSLGLSWIEIKSKRKTLVKTGKVVRPTVHYLLEESFPILFNGKEYARVNIGKELWIMQDTEVLSTKWIIGIAIAIFAIFFMIRLFIQKEIILPLNSLIHYFGSGNLALHNPSVRSHSAEMDELIQSFQNVRKQLIDYQNRMVKTEKEAALGALAAQVAHDIRSPLTALSVVNEDLSELPENKRLLVRSAVSRIRDIANSLIEIKKSQTSPELTEPSQVHLLLPVIENIISEKRIQFRDKLGIQIEVKTTDEAYGVFANIQQNKLKNVLSNLIDNAVESISTNGQVTVTLNLIGEAVSLLIEDTGKGIPKTVLPLLFQKGATFNKAGGSGLGLYSAKQTIQEMQGSISISSVEERGTKIEILLPKAQQPAWFVDSIQLRSDAVIGILDDDVSIHHTWKKRFETTVGSSQTLIHFSTPEELEAWIAKPGNMASLLLVDYELRNHAVTGIDIIQKLGLQNKAILVTSHSDEREIIQNCERLGVALLPKALANSVPISIKNVV